MALLDDDLLLEHVGSQVALILCILEDAEIVGLDLELLLLVSIMVPEYPTLTTIVRDHCLVALRIRGEPPHAGPELIEVHVDAEVHLFGIVLDVLIDGDGYGTHGVQPELI
jgi:hypothetical protein